MAKRKRLNLRLVLALSVIVLILLVLGAYGAYKMGLHRKIIRINPVEASRKADAAREQGDYKGAEKNLLRAISAAPTPKDKADYYSKFCRLQLDWLAARSAEMNDAERSDHSNRAVLALRQAIVQDRTHLDTQRLLTELMWSVGRRGNWMLFINEADALLELTPDDDKTTFMRALAWAELARAVPGTNSTNAIRDFRKAIELKGDEANYHREYTRFLQQEGRIDEVVRAYEDAIKRVPNDGDLRIQYAALLVDQNRPGEAMQQIQEAIARDPTNPTGNLALADRLLRTGKTDQALVALEKARQIDDSDYRVYGVLSMVYRMQNQPEKSMATLRDGLAVVDKRLAGMTTTAPADEVMSRILNGNRFQLLALLGNALVDEASRTTDEAARTAPLAEATEILGKMTQGQAAPGQCDKLEGRLALLQGDVTKAQDKLEKAYEALGPDRYVAEALIRIYFSKNLPGKAEQIIDAMRRNPALANDPRLLLAKAQLETRYGNLDEASRLLAEVLRGDPNNADALSLRQSILTLRGESSVDEMLAAGPKTPRSTIAALLGRAQSLWLADQRNEAIALLERVHAKVPDDAVVRYNLLAYYVGVENVPKAKGLLAEIKAAYPERTATLELQEKFIEETDRQKRYQLALQLADLTEDPLRRAMEKASHSARYGDVEGQGRYLREAYQIRPEEPAVVERLMDYGIERQDWAQAEECVETAKKFNLDGANGQVFGARVAMAKKDYAKAAEDLREAVSKQPESKFAWVMLGDCYTQLGDLDQAEKAFMTVAKADPTYVPALIALAVLTERLNRMAEHTGWIERAHRLAPTHPYVLQKYLEILEGRGEVDVVVAQRERLLRGDPSDIDNRARLAWLYEKQQQAAKAEALYVGLCTDAPNKITAARMLAAFYVRTGRSSQADKLLADLTQTASDKVAAYIVYADYLTGVNPDRAHAAVTKAVELDPKDARAYVALATVLVQRQDWAGAADALSKCLEVQPEATAVAPDIVRYRINAGQLPQAEQQLQALLAANPSDANLLTLKGNLAMGQGNVSQAVEAYDRALQIDPSHAEALVGQAGVFLTQGKPVEAKLALTKARGLSKNPQIAMVLSQLHLRLGDVEMASSVLREVLSQPETSDYAPAMRQLLQIYEQQQRWPKVAELLAEAKTKFPNDAYYLIAEARMYRQSGNRARTVAALESALKIAPGSKDVLVGYLLALLEAGDLNKVLMVADSYKDQPNYGPAAAAVRARALVKLNRAPEADVLFLTAFETASPLELTVVVDQLKQAVGLNVAVSKMTEWARARPQDAPFHLLLAGLYVEVGDLPKGAEIYTKASELATQPRDKAAAQRELGLVYYRMGRFPQAEQAYLASLQAYATDPATLNNLAYLYTSDLGLADKGLPYAAQAAQLAPNNPDVADTYGWSLAKTGNYAQAERELTRALQLGSAPAVVTVIRYHLGWVCEQMRRPEEAARHYTQGLQIVSDPNDPARKDLSEGLRRVQQMQGENPQTRSAP
ncbi:MAG: tetratricopeptide repeat protein [Phycisphaerae bacterium]|nr:tetratricopeptide repeat protein [Phycisphaerae bacterium]